MDIAGLPVTFLDTAGLRDTDDIVEGLGVAKAKERAAAADLRIYMLLSNEGVSIDLDDDDLIVIGKDDEGQAKAMGVSGQTGAGIDALIAAIATCLATRVGNIGVAMRERHRIAMLKAVIGLETARAQIEQGDFLADIVAEDLRSAIRAIDSLVGRIDVEDVLGEIFSSFCIGK